MALAFLVIGIVIIVVAISNRQNEAFSMLIEDLTGSGGLFAFIGVILLIGLIGGVTGFTRTSRMLIMLLIVVYALTRENLWGAATKSLSALQKPSATSTTAVGEAKDIGGGSTGAQPGGETPPSGGGGSSPASGGGGLSGILGQAKGLLGGVFK